MRIVSYAFWATVFFFIQILLAALKLLDIIKWSWTIVLIPFWLYLILVAAAFVASLIYVLLIKRN